VSAETPTLRLRMNFMEIPPESWETSFEN